QYEAAKKEYVKTQNRVVITMDVGTRAYNYKGDIVEIAMDVENMGWGGLTQMLGRTGRANFETDRFIGMNDTNLTQAFTWMMENESILNEKGTDVTSLFADRPDVKALWDTFLEVAEQEGVKPVDDSFHFSTEDVDGVINKIITGDKFSEFIQPGSPNGTTEHKLVELVTNYQTAVEKSNSILHKGHLETMGRVVQEPLKEWIIKMQGSDVQDKLLDIYKEVEDGTLMDEDGVFDSKMTTPVERVNRVWNGVVSNGTRILGMVKKELQNSSDPLAKRIVTEVQERLDNLEGVKSLPSSVMDTSIDSIVDSAQKKLDDAVKSPEKYTSTEIKVLEQNLTGTKLLVDATAKVNEEKAKVGEEPLKVIRDIKQELNVIEYGMESQGVEDYMGLNKSEIDPLRSAIPQFELSFAEAANEKEIAQAFRELARSVLPSSTGFSQSAVTVQTNNLSSNAQETQISVDTQKVENMVEKQVAMEQSQKQQQGRFGAAKYMTQMFLAALFRGLGLGDDDKKVYSMGDVFGGQQRRAEKVVMDSIHNDMVNQLSQSLTDKNVASVKLEMPEEYEDKIDTDKVTTDVANKLNSNLTAQGAGSDWLFERIAQVHTDLGNITTVDAEGNETKLTDDQKIDVLNNSDFRAEFDKQTSLNASGKQDQMQRLMEALNKKNKKGADAMGDLPGKLSSPVLPAELHDLSEGFADVAADPDMTLKQKIDIIKTDLNATDHSLTDKLAVFSTVVDKIEKDTKSQDNKDLIWNAAMDMVASSSAMPQLPDMTGVYDTTLRELDLDDTVREKIETVLKDAGVDTPAEMTVGGLLEKMNQPGTDINIGKTSYAPSLASAISAKFAEKISDPASPVQGLRKMSYEAADSALKGVYNSEGVQIADEPSDWNQFNNTAAVKYLNSPMGAVDTFDLYMQTAKGANIDIQERPEMVVDVLEKTGLLSANTSTQEADQVMGIINNYNLFDEQMTAKVDHALKQGYGSLQKKSEILNSVNLLKAPVEDVASDIQSNIIQPMENQGVSRTGIASAVITNIADQGVTNTERFLQILSATGILPETVKTTVDNMIDTLNTEEGTPDNLLNNTLDIETVSAEIKREGHSENISLLGLIGQALNTGGTSPDNIIRSMPVSVLPDIVTDSAAGLDINTVGDFIDNFDAVKNNAPYQVSLQ
ncbi:hypothetical protein ACFLTD_03430, partial [Elusimicrobiota bacterium]